MDSSNSSINSEQWQTVGSVWSETTQGLIQWQSSYLTQGYIGRKDGAKSQGSLWWSRSVGMFWRKGRGSCKLDGEWIPTNRIWFIPLWRRNSLKISIFTMLDLRQWWCMDYFNDQFLQIKLASSLFDTFSPSLEATSIIRFTSLYVKSNWNFRIKSLNSFLLM